MNEIYEITIKGKIELDGKIEPETEYSLALERLQNEEGKFSVRIDKMDRKVITYKMVNLGKATLISEGQVLKGKAKNNKQSVALRMAIMDYYNNVYTGDLDEESFYKSYMSKIIDSVKNKII